MKTDHDDVYLYVGHEPYSRPEAPVPINATIVHARTLLHPRLPQPDAARMFRCLTEVPRRRGEVVPLSTLTFELDGGRLWPDVADWESVADGIASLGRSGACDAMPLALPFQSTMLLSNGPATVHHVQTPNGEVVLGAEQRRALLDDLAGHVTALVASGPLWPGDDLVVAPNTPRRMPFQPYQSEPEGAERTSRWGRRRR